MTLNNLFSKKIILAIPKGRILEELKDLFEKKSIIIDPELYNESSRKLTFATNLPYLEIIKVRSFDVATIVKFGGADIGICGNDVIKEFPSQEYYAMIDLNIGKCRLSLASIFEDINVFDIKNKIRVATKYVNITKEYFENISIQAEIIKLNGSLEIAPKIKLCNHIVDLVSSGKTLKENNLNEILKILDISSWLIVNRTSLKTNNNINNFINLFNE
jgi:ATP phosphoribosyltransferase